MTAVEEIRQAAALIRALQGEFWDVLADWLDDEAVGAQTSCGEPTAHALAVARAYLAGEQS